MRLINESGHESSAALSMSTSNLPQRRYAIDGARRGQPPLILLHRFRGTISDWDPQFIALMSATAKRGRNLPV